MDATCRPSTGGVVGLRPATLADAPAIYPLLEAEVALGLIRPVEADEVARTAHQHLVWTVDGAVVGTVRLAPYGRWAEFSRFAMHPGYRGRGWARLLGSAVIEWAAELGYAELFALSIDPRMWRFFESLGFCAIEREALPAAWQAGYDFGRPSRAFHRPVTAGQLLTDASPPGVNV